MKFPEFFRNTTTRNSLKALAAGIIGLAATIGYSYHMMQNVEQAAENEFRALCDEVGIKMRVRLSAQAQLLRCGAAFFAASDSVGRKEWKAFYENSLIDQNLPGILGFGYASIIPKKELQQHISRVRNEGYPEYRVKPETDREMYTSIIYLEPFNSRNSLAFGYDMYSEPTRRAAMSIARDSNMAAITGKVFLVQETKVEPQAGMLMYVPVYRTGMPAETVEQRRTAIRGWVYSPYRMDDLMKGILGNWEMTSQGRIQLQIFDGDDISAASLLYNSQNGTIARAGSWTFQLPVTFNGKKWTLLFTRTDKFRAITETEVVLVFAGDLIISILIFILALVLFNTQYRARKIAKKLTDEVENASQRLALAVRAGGVGIWDWDVVKNVLGWDDQMYALYGITGDRFQGAYQSWLDGLHPDDKERGNREIMACLKGDAPFDTEFRVCWPDGSVHILRAMAIVERDGEGNPLHVIGTNWDITDSKMREEELLNAKITADYASASKSEFLSRMSHELRTPLNAILGFAQLLDIGALTTSQKRAVQQILGGGKKLLEMINNVLDISSMDAGMLDLSIEPVAITDLLPGILDDIKPLAFEKRISIQLSDSLYGDEKVKADRIRFRQVLYNLVSNAVKFNKEGGSVTIHSERMGEGNAGAYLRVVVTDTGIGIRQKNLKHLFHPFERVEPDQIDYSGRGLGLAVLRKLVLAMNGRYGVESTYGEGSTFWIELPCAS